eukprot:552637-Prymnesium_polylepis.1
MSNLRSGDKLGNDDDAMTGCLCQDAAPGPGRAGRGGARPRAVHNILRPRVLCTIPITITIRQYSTLSRGRNRTQRASQWVP